MVAGTLASFRTEQFSAKLGCPWAREGPDRATTSAGIAIWAMLACRLVKGSSFLIKPPRRLLRHYGVPKPLHPDRVTANEGLRSPHPSSGFGYRPILCHCQLLRSLIVGEHRAWPRTPLVARDADHADLEVDVQPEIASDNAPYIALETAAGVAGCRGRNPVGGNHGQHHRGRDCLIVGEFAVRPRRGAATAGPRLSTTPPSGARATARSRPAGKPALSERLRLCGQASASPRVYRCFVWRGRAKELMFLHNPSVRLQFVFT